MLPIVQIGPVAMQVPMLLILAGAWFGSRMAERAAARRGLAAAQIEQLIAVALAAGMVGARLGHALRFVDVYLQDPMAVLALTPVTLAGDVGVMAGGIAAMIYGQRRRMPWWPTLDALAVGGAAFAVAVALAHLASGDAYGAPSGVPWAIPLHGALRHPSQVYELLGATAILALLAVWDRGRLQPGTVAGAFTALTALARLVLEAFRGDSLLGWGGVRVAQVASLILLLVALAVLVRIAQQPHPDPSGEPNSPA